MLPFLSRESFPQVLGLRLALPNPLRVLGEFSISLTNVLLEACHAVIGILTFLLEGADPVFALLQRLGELLGMILLGTQVLFELKPVNA